MPAQFPAMRKSTLRIPQRREELFCGARGGQHFEHSKPSVIEARTDISVALQLKRQPYPTQSEVDVSSIGSMSSGGA